MGAIGSRGTACSPVTDLQAVVILFGGFCRLFLLIGRYFILSLADTFPCFLDRLLPLFVKLVDTWCYTKKVDKEKEKEYNKSKHERRKTKEEKMTNKQPQYDETFKKNIVALHQNGKTQTELSKEYGISVSAISRWIKLYSEVKVDDNTVMTAKQIKELQKRNAQLEEENIILKKALAIMTPRSGKE